MANTAVLLPEKWEPHFSSQTVESAGVSLEDLKTAVGGLHFLF